MKRNFFWKGESALDGRLTTKERFSLELAETFKYLCIRTGQPLSKIAEVVNIPIRDLKHLEGGRAHVLRGKTLFKVFEFLPIDDPEVRFQTSRLITSVSRSDYGRFHFHSQR